MCLNIQTVPSLAVEKKMILITRNLSEVLGAEKIVEILQKRDLKISGEQLLRDHPTLDT